MERMKQNIKYVSIGMYKQLEEENKKLKKECEENDYLVEDNARWMKKCGEKTMEIKKLKEELEKWKYGNSLAFDDIERICNEKLQLEEEIKKLQEKVNTYSEEYGKLREENRKLKEEDMAITHNLLLIEENKRLRKGIDIRLDSMGVKYIITEEGDYFAKSDFKITE